MGAVKKKEVLGVFAVFGIGALEFLSTFLLYRGVRSGTVISVRQAAAQPAAFLLQGLRECLLPAALLLLFAVLLKKVFFFRALFQTAGKMAAYSGSDTCSGDSGIHPLRSRCKTE